MANSIPVPTRVGSPTRTSAPGAFSSRMRIGDHVARAAAVTVRMGVEPHRRQADIINEMFGGKDEPTEIILRAATNPATLTGSGWASDLATQLATQALVDFVVGLAPASAGAALIARGMQIPMRNYAAIVVPTYVTTAADAGGFISEGPPIPVRSMNLDNAPALVPRKFGVITSFTSELAAQSNFANIVKQILGESVGLAIDTQLFSSNAADATRPPGLLNSVVALGAKAGGGLAAIAEDTKSLLDALTTAGGGRGVVFVASKATRAALKAQSPGFDYDILESSVVAKNTLIAIEAGAFVSGFLPAPEFSTTNQGVVHENTVPVPLIDGSSTVGAPARSFWQTSTIGLRTVLRCSWGMRSPGLVQYISSVSW